MHFDVDLVFRNEISMCLVKIAHCGTQSESESSASNVLYSRSKTSKTRFYRFHAMLYNIGRSEIFFGEKNSPLLNSGFSENPYLEEVLAETMLIFGFSMVDCL
jgi:hypothetical protein